MLVQAETDPLEPFGAASRICTKNGHFCYNLSGGDQPRNFRLISVIATAVTKTESSTTSTDVTEEAQRRGP
jgi:hypothetical protein